MANDYIPDDFVINTVIAMYYPITRINYFSGIFNLDIGVHYKKFTTTEIQERHGRRKQIMKIKLIIFCCQNL